MNFADVFESLRVLLFGMIGIFVTMGVIAFTLVILNNFSKDKNKEQKDK